jgi:hypothetical protein
MNHPDAGTVVKKCLMNSTRNWVAAHHSSRSRNRNPRWKKSRKMKAQQFAPIGGHNDVWNLPEFGILHTEGHPSGAVQAAASKPDEVL